MGFRFMERVEEAYFVEGLSGKWDGGSGGEGVGEVK
jgi:hypothetical protein